jgi:capsular exopolysaccharide synthesis family protein
MSKTYEALKRAEALRAKQNNEPHAAQEPADDLTFGDVGVSGADDYYELRRRLIGSAVGDAIKTVLVASALHGEGASSTACLLAKAMADRGRARALLVDLNLRTPSLWRMLGAKQRQGLTSVVTGERTLNEVVQPTPHEGVHLITAGNGYANAIDVIDNAKTLETVSDLGHHADVVFIDAAPVTLYPDARALAPLVDGVILVVEADVTPVAVANRAVEIIRDTGANLLGVVLNKRRDYIPDRVLQLVG